jgi:NADPH:quinone reductase-like Zn-dependent oxidoreductase
MRAVILKKTGSPADVISVTPDAPVPTRAPGDILVQVVASAVNPVEYKTVRGMLPAKMPKVCVCVCERERYVRGG